MNIFLILLNYYTILKIQLQCFLNLKIIISIIFTKKIKGWKKFQPFKIY